jgi:hypothetical protein
MQLKANAMHLQCASSGDVHDVSEPELQQVLISRKGSAMTSDISSMDVEKKATATGSYSPSMSDGEVATKPSVWAELKHTFSTREGWIGDYVSFPFYWRLDGQLDN